MICLEARKIEFVSFIVKKYNWLGLGNIGGTFTLQKFETIAVSKNFIIAKKHFSFENFCRDYFLFVNLLSLNTVNLIQ